MKRNIDLTQDRDFQKMNIISSLRNMFKKFQYHYPWSFENTLTSSLNYNQIFFTGNKIERQDKKDNRNYESQIECECCGKDLSKKKWEWYRGLCKECNERLYLGEFAAKRFLNKPWLKIYVEDGIRIRN